MARGNGCQDIVRDHVNRERLGASGVGLSGAQPEDGNQRGAGSNAWTATCGERAQLDATIR
jgi:hypothetical protein